MIEDRLAHDYTRDNIDGNMVVFPDRMSEESQYRFKNMKKSETEALQTLCTYFNLILDTPAGLELLKETAAELKKALKGGRNQIGVFMPELVEEESLRLALVLHAASLPILHLLLDESAIKNNPITRILNDAIAELLNIGMNMSISAARARAAAEADD